MTSLLAAGPHDVAAWTAVVCGLVAIAVGAARRSPPPPSAPAPARPSTFRSAPMEA